jgi:O-methyltransferase involved in polyketide biosynthesis
MTPLPLCTMKIKLNSVEETLLIPLWCRAQISKEYPSLCNDAKAIELVEAIDYDFSTIEERFNPEYKLSSVVRTKHFDDKIRTFIAEYPHASVINLGAGLDTTFYRVDNGSIHWYDLDLPNVIAIRKHLIPETDRTTYIAKSLFDPSWCSDVEHTENGVFVVSGAVLVYFEEAQVRTFFSLLADKLPGAEIVFNAYSPSEVSLINKALRSVGVKNATLKWALEDAREMTHWDTRIAIIDQFPYFKDIPRDPAWDEETIRRIDLSDEQTAMSIVHVRV